MKQHTVRTYKSAEPLARADQLAWKIAEVASDPVEVESDVIEMIGNRMIDNAAVAAASVARRPRRQRAGTGGGAPVPAGIDCLRSRREPAHLA